MALNRRDRLLTIVVTATLTSAAWIVVGSFVLVDGERPAAQADPAQTEPIPTPTAEPTDPQPTGISPPADEDTATLMIPVLDVSADELADTFTDGRDSGARLHEALDIMAPEGTSVVAAGPGTIERLFHSDAGGNTIYVRSPDGETIHYYAHLAEYAPGLREGQRIRRGQRLGAVGSTGNADPGAPHLHFAILRTTADAAWWEPATALNPYPILTGG